MHEIATRQDPGIGKENRRDEQEQEQLRIDFDAAESGQERGHNADDHQQDRQGQRCPMDQRAADGDGQE
jgi:hypothetical protein